jgi:hypothetical protein
MRRWYEWGERDRIIREQAQQRVNDFMRTTTPTGPRGRFSNLSDDMLAARMYRKEVRAGKTAYRFKRAASSWITAGRMAGEGRFVRAAGSSINAGRLYASARTPRMAKVAIPLAVAGGAFVHMKRKREQFYTHYFDY